MTFPNSVRAGLSVSLAVLFIACAGRTARADDIVGGPQAGVLSDRTIGDGAFRHLQALQDIAAASGGNRAAGTVGYDRSAQYMAERLKEAGYAVRFEEFEFPFFEEKSPPVLIVSQADGSPEPAPKEVLRTVASSGSADVQARLQPVNLELGDG